MGEIEKLHQFIRCQASHEPFRPSTFHNPVILIVPKLPCSQTNDTSDGRVRIHFGEPENEEPRPNRGVPPAGPRGGVLAPEARKRPYELLEFLTTREREVLSFIAEGRTSQQIVEELVVGMGTVKTHVHRIIAMLVVSDRTRAAVLAIRLGLVDVR